MNPKAPRTLRKVLAQHGQVALDFGRGPDHVLVVIRAGRIELGTVRLEGPLLRQLAEAFDKANAGRLEREGAQQLQAWADSPAPAPRPERPRLNSGGLAGVLALATLSALAPPGPDLLQPDE